MFDTVKFGKALSTLRKQADMTQNEVADNLNLSRQAISKYERGESFPDISVLVVIAPLLKPSVLTNLSLQFERQGIDISDIITLAEYLNDDSIVNLIETATFDDINDELLAKFIPMLNNASKEAIFQKILDGETDWHFIKVLLPYADNITTQIEAAVVAGALPREALDILKGYHWDENGYKGKQNRL